VTEKREATFAPLEDGDLDAVVALWAACGLTRPHNDPQTDITFARGRENSEVLVGKAAGEIVASVMVGHDGHRGTVYYVSVAPGQQNAGMGRQVMAAAEAWLVERGVWKLNLVIRAENDQVRGFYEALGYEVEPRILMSRWISPSRRGG
jgi:hypothetical protein